MSSFKRKVATQIATVSLILATIASPIAWFVARENAEESIVKFAMEESQRLLRHLHADQFQGEQARVQAQKATNTLAGGLFDIAELYDAHGLKLAEGLTAQGEKMESSLPSHGVPRYRQPLYKSHHLPDKQWALRVFIPLYADGKTLSGYFEGVRLIPDWQHQQILREALIAALMVSLASLICGGILYPVVIRLAAENEEKAKELLESHLGMMETLGRAIAQRDSDTGAHNYRVAWMSAMLAETIGLKDHAMQALIVGSFLHDAGKIGIADAILLKPGKLTDEEMNTMRTHVSIGEEIVAGAGWLEGARAVVAGHHEKWDGSGYPRRLKGEEIPLAARIFAITDVFDALCSKRPYKDPMPLDKAMTILHKDAGTHFDPTLIAAFSPLAEQLYASAQNTSEAEAKALMEDMVRRYFG